MPTVPMPVQEPRCPHCEKPYSGTFPGGDDVEVTCPACGQTTASPNWFAYEPEAGEDPASND